jgi:hypothetical protein
MSFLRNIASDLVEKRLWPLVALLGAALLAVLAYLALGGGGSAAVPAPVAVNATPASGVPVTAALANPNVAVSETTTGARYQRQAGAHDPFVPLSGAAPPATQTSVSPASAGAATGGSAVTLAKKVGTSGGSSAATPAPSTPAPTTLTPPSTTPPSPSTPTPTPTPSANTHPVDVRFGTIPTTVGADGTTQQGTPVLVDHANLARLSPLPNAKSPIVVFMGVRPDGKTATFALMHEAILRGDATCRPSALKCQLIDLKAGQKEQLDYVTPSLSVVHYELDLVSVGAGKVAQAAAVRFYHRESAAGRKLLQSHFPPGVGGLTFSYRTGSLQTAPAAAAARSSRATPVTATAANGSPAYAPPLPHAGPPVVQPGWLVALLHAL